MKRKCSIQLVKGKYSGLVGYTFDVQPNIYGNVMFYSNQGKNPYRYTAPANEVLYLEEGKEWGFGIKIYKLKGEHE